jgi:hypothetical protein
MMTLSTPQPLSALSTCSTVWILAWPDLNRRGAHEIGHEVDAGFSSGWPLQVDAPEYETAVHRRGF